MSANEPQHESPTRDTKAASERSRARWPLTLAAVLITLALLFTVAWSALRWKDKMRPGPAPVDTSAVSQQAATAPG